MARAMRAKMARRTTVRFTSPPSWARKLELPAIGLPLLLRLDGFRHRRRGVEAVRRGREIGQGRAAPRLRDAGELQVRNRDDAAQVREFGQEGPDIVVVALHGNLDG